MRTGWKRLAAAKSDEQAIERLSRAALLLSEALSNINSVLQASSVVVGIKYYSIAEKMYEEIKVTENRETARLHNNARL